ncbi:MAG TPA: 50S ribosomal protein L5, partial [Thermoplasmata archaeon]|nr:50S ribosomal protein L5 [Thermoplasmata archaeon]
AGMKYDPEIGIRGMDVTVEMGRAGYRVRDRKIRRRPVRRRLRVSREETRAFLTDRFRLTYLE